MQRHTSSKWLRSESVGRLFVVSFDILYAVIFLCSVFERLLCLAKEKWIMSFDVFLNFDGDCRDALAFYAGVFKLTAPEHIMTYGQAPGFSGQEADKDRIIYASLPIFGCNVMFSDCPSGSEYIKGTNIALTLGTSDADEIKRVYAALSDGGTIAMALGKTFFSELYAMVTDKFDITWQLSLTPPETGALPGGKP